MSDRSISNRQQHILEELQRSTRIEHRGSIEKSLQSTEFRNTIRDLNDIISSGERLHPDLIQTWERFLASLVEIPNERLQIDEESLDELVHHLQRRSHLSQAALHDIINITENVISEKKRVDLTEINVQADDDVVFLLGAGASVDSGIPTVNGLLDELLIQAQRTQMEDLDPLISFCEGRDDIDIEDVLTATYLSDFAVSENYVLQLLHHFLFSEADKITEKKPNADVTSVNFIQNTLQTLFGLLSSTMIPKDPNDTHIQIQEFIDSHDKSSIVTTNYDYCMDEQLINNGFDIEYFIEGSDPPKTEGEESLDLVKMHGSVNWWYCSSCQSVGQVSPETAKQSSDDSSMDYPVIGVCPHCGGQRRPLLVPPISFKFVMFPPLIRIWDRGKQIIEQADYIIAVGYSFSDSDAYIYKIISKSLTEESNTTLINVNPDSSVTKRLKERFTAELGDFDPEEQIIGIHQESQEIMEDLTESMLDYEDSSPEGEAPPSEEPADSD